MGYLPNLFQRLFECITLKYKDLHHAARHIDHLIDHSMPSKNAPFISQSSLESLITCNFPDLFMTSQGWHKLVFGSHNAGNTVVLKVGPKKTIENDHHAYKRVPEKQRHQYFARIYWHTKYCLLQQYGLRAHVSPEQLRELRQAVYKYGIFDIKPENLRLIDGKLKIIDANVTRVLLPTMLRKIDEVKPRLPQKLHLFIKKVTKRFYER
jgi:hypothetical protein